MTHSPMVTNPDFKGKIFTSALKKKKKKKKNKVILGYPWFAAFQPQIDWKRGWINHGQLPIILWRPDAP
jgi:hypothetical protein